MLTIAVGLPGSGKTSLGRFEHLKAPELQFHDDFLGGKPSNDRASSLNGVLAAVQQRRDIFAADALLCLESHRRAVAQRMARITPRGYVVRWLYFSNAPMACRRNAEKRLSAALLEPDRGAIEAAPHELRASLDLIETLTPLYQVPEGATTIEVIDYTATRFPDRTDRDRSATPRW